MKLVVFDVDGTLTNTMKVDAECFHRAFAEVFDVRDINTNWSDYTHVTDSGITIEILEKHAARAPTGEELSRLKGRFIELLVEAFERNPDSIQPIRGAREALGSLTEDSGWAVAIATGAWRVSATLKLATARIEVDGIPAAFSDDRIARESIVERAIELARDEHDRSAFDRVVYVGDAIWDIKTSRNLGIGFIGVAEGDERERMREDGASHVIPHFGDYEKFYRYLELAEVPRGVAP